jgi:hypothetical protein
MLLMSSITSPLKEGRNVPCTTLLPIWRYEEDEGKESGFDI